MGEVKWVKISTDIFDNRKIRQIESMPEGDSLLVIWFKLISLAGTINDSGAVYFSKEIPYTEEMLATHFNRPLATIRLALTIFSRFEMIEIVEDIIYLSSWTKYQSTEKLAEIRKKASERVARHRQLRKEKEECNVTGNVTCNVTVTPNVTLRNALDIDIDIDKDIEKDIEKEIYKEKVEKQKTSIFSSLFKAFTKNKELLVALEDFVTMRNKIKKPLTERAIKNILSKLSKFSDNDKLQMLEMSITNCWSDVYEKNKGNIKGGGKFDKGGNDTNGHYQGKELGDVF